MNIKGTICSPDTKCLQSQYQSSPSLKCISNIYPHFTTSLVMQLFRRMQKDALGPVGLLTSMAVTRCVRVLIWQPRVAKWYCRNGQRVNFLVWSHKLGSLQMFNQTGTDRHLTFKIQFWLNSQRKASVNSALTNIKSIKLSMFACTGINIAIGFCIYSDQC